MIYLIFALVIMIFVVMLGGILFDRAAKVAPYVGYLVILAIMAVFFSLPLAQ